MKNNNQFWRRASAAFDERAAEYDQWFDSSPLYKTELAAVREIRTGLAAPRLEIGVGPGRFAGDLGVRFGLDPAAGPLRLARKRGIEVCRATGEALPVTDACIGSVYILFSLCFLADPRQALRECRRVLTAGGGLVLGMINRHSAWGAMLDDKKRADHPFYRYATLYDPETVTGWLDETGFTVVEARSSLLLPPESFHEPEASRDGIVPGAGFTVMAATLR